MSPYTESVNSPVMLPPADGEPRARARIEPERASRATPAPRRPIRALERMDHDQRATQRPRSWRDAIQAFAHDAAEVPVIARLLAGQGILLLGYASVYGALALRRRFRSASAPRPAEETYTPTRPRHRPRPLLVGATAATGLAFAWAALMFIARTRAIPAVTAIFTYGAALRQYARPLRPPTRAA